MEALIKKTKGLWIDRRETVNFLINSRIARNLFMNSKQLINAEDAFLIGEQVGVDWTQIELEQFRIGLEVEHNLHNMETDGANDDPVLTGKNTWARLKDVHDDYMQLGRVEASGEAGVERTT
jgi:Protein of unknown function (DUF5661)